MKHEVISEKIIKAICKGYYTPGFGFPEKVYQNALFIQLKQEELSVENQKKIEVYYFGRNIFGFSSK